MTMTTKPSPATLLPCPFCGRVPVETHRACAPDLTYAFVHFVVCMCCTYSAKAHITGYGDTPEIAQMDARSNWNANGCADGHAPIRYTGDKCPLCEALKLSDKRLFAFYQLWDLADRTVGGDTTETQFVDGRRDIIAALSQQPALSRPSEAPDHVEDSRTMVPEAPAPYVRNLIEAPTASIDLPQKFRDQVFSGTVDAFLHPSEPDHIFCGDSDNPAAICDRSDCGRPLSDHVREFAPGAGEEGK